MIKIIRKIPKSILLLISIFVFVFIVPLIKNPNLIEIVNTLSYSLILASIFSIIDNKTRFLRYLIVVAISLIWLMFFSKNQAAEYIAFLFSILVFLIATVVMIMQIISSETVTPRVITETINGYLLIGVIFGFINTIILWISPGAISIGENKTMSDIMYYSFITVTTIGYGDISPISQGARSVSILFGVISQLYLAIIMALIIGKYLNKN